MTKMSVQTTLFGKAVKKKPFFEKSVSADSGYYAVVEALWTLHPCGANRQTFFEKAQRLWKDVYSQSDLACRELFAKAGKVSSDRTVAKSFIVEKTSDDTESVEVADDVGVPSAQPDSPAQSTIIKTGPTISSAVDAFFEAMGLTAEAFLTEEVRIQETLISKLSQVAKKWEEYSNELSFYNSSSTYTWKQSLLSLEIKNVKDHAALLAKALSEAASIKISFAQILTPSGSLSVQRKQKALTDVTVQLCILEKHLETCNLRLRRRNAQMQKKGGIKTTASDIRLYCSTTPEMPWEECIDQLVTAAEENKSLGAPLSAQKISDCAGILKETNAMPLLELLGAIESDFDDSTSQRVFSHIVYQLCDLLPVLAVFRCSTKTWVLVNLADFTLSAGGDTFADLFLLANPSDCQDDEKHLAGSPVHVAVTEEPEDDDTYCHLPKHKPGPVPVYQQFPDLVLVVTEFIQSHGFSAQNRRRNEIGNAMGVTLAEIQGHVMEKMPELKKRGISRTTIHELLVAPRSGTINASRYHGLVKARVPGKDNSERKYHQDAHFAFAQVKYVREMAVR
jgi:hypothetical protein